MRLRLQDAGAADLSMLQVLPQEKQQRGRRAMLGRDCSLVLGQAPCNSCSLFLLTDCPSGKLIGQLSEVLETQKRGVVRCFVLRKGVMLAAVVQRRCETDSRDSQSLRPTLIPSIRKLIPYQILTFDSAAMVPERR